jgi:surface protein
MFRGAHAFNQPLEQWNVGNVTNMDNMFCCARAFNQPLEQWNVSNVANMQSMFSGSGMSSGNKPPRFR